MALIWCFNEPWPAAANNSLITWPNWPKPALRAAGDACRPVMASARNFKFKWKRDEEFSTQIWMLNDRHQELDAGVVRAILMSGKKVLELGSWEFESLTPNSNMEGPVMKTKLPRWSSNGFILHLEVEGHPEYNSEYTFLLSD